MLPATDQNGCSVALKDIWPSDEEIDASSRKSAKPEKFRKV